MRDFTSSEAKSIMQVIRWPKYPLNKKYIAKTLESIQKSNQFPRGWQVLAAQAVHTYSRTIPQPPVRPLPGLFLQFSQAYKCTITIWTCSLCISSQASPGHYKWRIEWQQQRHILHFVFSSLLTIFIRQNVTNPCVTVESYESWSFDSVRFRHINDTTCVNNLSESQYW